jgi:hypothetical protein
MKKKIFVVLIFVVAALVSCGSNEPKVYTSIEGSWRCEEINPIIGQRIYIVDIDRKKSDTTQYVLSNFYNVDVLEFVIAKLNEKTLTISPLQQVGTQQQLVVKSGSGIVSSDFRRIVFTYTIFDGQNDFEVQAVYSR